MFFTIWYGVFDRETWQILFASGGHPPAILMTTGSSGRSEIHQLKTPGIVIGAEEDAQFQNSTYQIKPRDRLYIFSDGVYEITRTDGSMQTLREFLELLATAPKDEGVELNYIVQATQALQGKAVFADDFSIIEFIFNQLK